MSEKEKCAVPEGAPPQPSERDNLPFIDFEAVPGLLNSRHCKKGIVDRGVAAITDCNLRPRLVVADLFL